MVLERLREPEIQHLHRAVFSDLHIGRLQIAMNDSNLVSRFETVSHLPRNGDDFIQRDWRPGDPVGKSRPFDELEDERLHTLGVFHAVNASDVGMVQ